MKCSNHVTPILADLHWLLVMYLIQYKVAVTDLHIYNLDAVPPVHVVSNHVDTDKLTTANGGTLTSSSASRSHCLSGSEHAGTELSD